MLSRLKRPKEEGFTIVELMVTIFIMAILGVIAFNVYNKQKMQSYSAVVKSDVMNAAIYIASNQDTLKGYASYTQDDTTPIEGGIPGYVSSSGVEIAVFGAETTNTGKSCVQGFHSKDKSVGGAGAQNIETSWHVNLTDKKLVKGKCTWSVG